MPALESHIVPQSDTYRQNHAAFTELVGRLRTLEDRTRDKSRASHARFEQRGQLLPRGRFDRLLDADAPSFGLSTLVGFCLDRADPARSIPNDGFITSIGWVSDVRVMIVVDDAGIGAEVVQPMGIGKFQRAQAIALKQKLPSIHLVESTGVSLLMYCVGTFTRGDNDFYWLARPLAASIPVIGVVCGLSTAGDAYMPGLSDYVVMVRGRARAFLVGPPLLKVAASEVVTEGKLGGVEMHATISSLAEYLAEDDADMLRIVCELVAAPDWNRDVPAPDGSHASPRFDAEGLPGTALTNRRRLLDMCEVIACFIDGSNFPEFKSDYGPSMIARYATICGMRVGVITNNGSLDPAGATEVMYFIQVYCQSDTPLLYLQNTTGFIVGKASEQTGMVKRGLKMIQAIASAIVPRITIRYGVLFGADNYGMSGRDFLPDFCFSRPGTKTAVMDAEQAAGTMVTVMTMSMQRKTQTVNHDAIEAMRAKVIDTFERQSDTFTVSDRLLDDGVIDPRDTHKALACVLGTCDKVRRRTLYPVQFDVARPQPSRPIHEQPRTTGARHHALHP